MGLALGMRLGYLSGVYLLRDNEYRYEWLGSRRPDVSGDPQGAYVVATADQTTNNNATRERLKNIWPLQVDVYQDDKMNGTADSQASNH